MSEYGPSDVQVGDIVRLTQSRLLADGTKMRKVYEGEVREFPGCSGVVGGLVLDILLAGEGSKWSIELLERPGPKFLKAEVLRLRHQKYDNTFFLVRKAGGGFVDNNKQDWSDNELIGLHK